MATDEELREWARSRDAHHRSVNAKRAVRYMADVRHPLKARRLDEPPLKWWVHRVPFVPKPEVPDEAPCAKCGKVIKIRSKVRHHCF
jgi:hypothetical protein